VKIWLITVGEPLPLFGSTARPWRTGVLAETLRARGHTVVWWTSTVDHFNKRYFTEGCSRVEVAPRFQIQFLHGRMYRENISIARLLNHLEIARLFRVLSSRELPPDLILSSYPTIELCDEAVQYGTKHSVPVLLDIRDLWPDEIAARMPDVLRPFAPLFLWPIYRRARRAVERASGIIAISRTYMNWAYQFGRRSRVPCDLLVPLGYQPHEATRTVPAELEAKLISSGVDPSRKIVWFCGTFVGSIDLGTVVEAARLLTSRTEFQFVLTGSGEKDAIWREQARDLGNVVFTGWAGRDELAWLSRQAWVGLGAYKPGAMMSLPNKLFEYMSAGLPILCALEGEARELIETHRIGLMYKAGDPQDLARCLCELAGDVSSRRVLSANALSTFRERFAADLVYPRFADHLERCATDLRDDALSAVVSS
jgi:glycosyltransferase involved in cell wall biosynthesis